MVLYIVTTIIRKSEYFSHVYNVVYNDFDNIIYNNPKLSKLMLKLINSKFVELYSVMLWDCDNQYYYI